VPCYAKVNKARLWAQMVRSFWKILKSNKLSQCWKYVMHLHNNNFIISLEYFVNFEMSIKHSNEFCKFIIFVTFKKVPTFWTSWFGRSIKFEAKTYMTLRKSVLTCYNKMGLHCKLHKTPIFLGFQMFYELLGNWYTSSMTNVTFTRICYLDL
jgi:hypothetical protein